MTLNRTNIDLLRFSVIGSVDDGKSTLIGRLLYDSKSILEDQLNLLEESRLRKGDDRINLAFLTDGLREERERGITIDVAYRYFATPKRKFIIADCPGHFEYTRNMVTGTSSANLSIVMVDSRHGLVEQTKRHTFIANLMNIKHLVFCINKMDLIGYSQTRFEEIKEELESFISRLNIPDVHIIPISALEGDNIVDKSQKMNWYQGPSLLYILENIHLGSDSDYITARFPIQLVIGGNNYAGRIEGGVFKPGDEITVLPSGQKSKIKKIQSMGNPDINEAFHPMSVLMTLADDMVLSRGNFIVKPNRPPQVTREIDMMICWFNEKNLEAGKIYQMKHTTNDTDCQIKEVQYKVDINTLHKSQDDNEIGMNDIGKVIVGTTEPVFIDKFSQNKNTGSVIFIDKSSNETIAAGMII